MAVIWMGIFSPSIPVIWVAVLPVNELRPGKKLIAGLAGGGVMVLKNDLSTREFDAVMAGGEVNMAARMARNPKTP